ncbi:hypothetical protein D3C75_849890 [compost metagenome]
MPILLPMLRIRLNSAVHSLRWCGARVAKVMVDNGTKMKPRPSPWTKPVRTMSQPLTSRVKPVISHSDRLVSSRPAKIR